MQVKICIVATTLKTGGGVFGGRARLPTVCLIVDTVVLRVGSEYHIFEPGSF